jgi:hypothetical protein
MVPALEAAFGHAGYVLSLQSQFLIFSFDCSPSKTGLKPGMPCHGPTRFFSDAAKFFATEFPKNSSVSSGTPRFAVSLVLHYIQIER